MSVLPWVLSFWPFWFGLGNACVAERWRRHGMRKPSVICHVGDKGGGRSQPELLDTSLFHGLTSEVALGLLRWTRPQRTKVDIF